MLRALRFPKEILLPHGLNFTLFWVGFPTKNYNKQKVITLFTRETDKLKGLWNSIRSHLARRPNFMVLSTSWSKVSMVVWAAQG